MRDEYPRIRALGGDVLAVTADPPAQAAAYRRDLGLPFPVVSDPARVAFRAYGLARSARAVLTLRTLRETLRAWPRTGLRPPGRDVWQLGGTFVLDREGCLALAHPARDPADHPALAAVLAVMARHHAAVVRGRRARLRPPLPDEPGADADGMAFVVEAEAGPAGAVRLYWPSGPVEVLARDPARWDAELERDALAALARYAREELGLALSPPG